MSICDVLCQLQGFEPRLQKSYEKGSKRQILQQARHITILDDNTPLSVLQKEARLAQHFLRKKALKYVFSGLKNAYDVDCIQDRRLHLQTDTSALRHVEIPTFRIRKNTLKKELSRHVTHLERKYELQYGSWDNPLITYCDFLLQHNTQTYFALVMRGLQDYERDRFLLLDKIGQDIYESQYGGFVIFTPLDDPTVKVHVESPLELSAKQLGTIITDEQLVTSKGTIEWRKLSSIVKKQQRKTTNTHYKKTYRNKKVGLILRQFPQTAHIMGLPYDISQKEEYFLDIATEYGIERKK